MPRLAWIAALLGGFWASTAFADLDARVMAVNCRNCHGSSTQPESQAAIPALNSLPKAQLRQMLLDYKYDRKSATLMPRLAKGYSDGELAALAEYLGTD